MTYRNGKCYDNHGNEMTQSQINQMYNISKEYIDSINKTKNNRINDDITKEDVINKLSEKFTVR